MSSTLAKKMTNPVSPSIYMFQTFTKVIEDELLYHYPLDQCKMIEENSTIKVFKDDQLIYFYGGTLPGPLSEFHFEHLTDKVFTNEMGFITMRKGAFN